MSEQRWDYLTRALGPPGSAEASHTSGELTAAGWELLGVHFKSGLWHFRRARSEDTPSVPEETADP